MKKAYQLIESGDVCTQSIIQHEKRISLRLNKFISNSGFCSRREADRYIEEGKVTIDGNVAQMGEQVFEGQEVRVNNQSIVTNKEFVYIVLNKPVGIICTTDTSIPNNIVNFMNYDKTIFPIGRLDKDSSGLILLTNDGDIVNKILRASNHHEKEYIVSVNKDINKEFIEKMREGVKIYNPVNNTYQITNKAYVKKIGKRSFNIVLTQGLNRQIRRMCTVLGYRVQTLQRIRIMNVHLAPLEVGQWRYMSTVELQELNEILKKSKSC